jgi:hypothetical protein
VSVGAWDSGPFDNDDGADFAAQLTAAPNWNTVREALQSALRLDYLEAQLASEAVAAASFVAAAYSGDSSLALGGGPGLLKLLGPVPVELRVLAAEALPRIAERSELAELWNESEDGGVRWLEGLSAIGARL